MSTAEVPHDVEVIRSTKRRKTVQARMVGERIVVRVPAHLTEKEEADAVAEVVRKLGKKTSSLVAGDAELTERADELNRKFLEGRATVGSIRWVGNQNSRWGSCSTATGDIRISDRLKHVPGYVLDSVIVHELVHTFISGHTAEFHRWASRAPNAERAEGYLEAYSRWGSGAGSGAGS